MALLFPDHTSEVTNVFKQLREVIVHVFEWIKIDDSVKTHLI